MDDAALVHNDDGDGGDDDDAPPPHCGGVLSCGVYSDRESATTFSNWNVGFHLPPVVQLGFRQLIDL